MARNDLKTIRKYVVLPFLLLVVIDYLNIPTLVGIDVIRINPNVFNSMIVVFLYITTYFLIDKRQIQRDDNAKMVASVLLESSYTKCLDNIKLLDNQKLLSKYIVPKIDFSKASQESRVYTNLEENPFTEYKSLIDFSANGVLSGKEINTYLNIMNEYKKYLSMRITFYDIWKSTKPEHIDLMNRIEQQKVNLSNLINTEIDRLKSV